MASYLRWSDLAHLTTRTVSSLKKPVIDPEYQRWVLALMNERERLLFRSMSQAERAHGIDCALRITEILGYENVPVIVAAALHDVGKTSAGLATSGRIVASLISLILRDRIQPWANQTGRRGQIGRYLDHSRIGADMLRDAGSHHFVVFWARSHHLDDDQIVLDDNMFTSIGISDGAELVRNLKSVDY